MTSDTRASHATGDGYHHGDLPNALRRAAVEVIEERGVGGFSLREVARRAGVSHTAPAHHFGDMKGLLTSVAEEGFHALYEVTSAAIDGVDDPAEQLYALGRAYVRLAKSNKGHCEVMFRSDLITTDDARLLEEGLCAYGVIEGAVRNLIETEGLRASLDEATWLCWSAMQGLVQLEPDLARIATVKGGQPVETDELISRFLGMILNGIRGVDPSAGHR